jgi:hypothetical protein
MVESKRSYKNFQVSSDQTTVVVRATVSKFGILDAAKTLL